MSKKETTKNNSNKKKTKQPQMLNKKFQNIL